MTKRKREKTQITKIKNESGDMTSDSIRIKRIIRDYYEQLYTNNLNNLDIIDNFQETQSLLRMSHEQMKTSEQTKVLGLMASLVYSTKCLKRAITPMFLKHFQKIEKEETLPNSVYEANITLISKPDRHYRKTTNQYLL